MTMVATDINVGVSCTKQINTRNLDKLITQQNLFVTRDRYVYLWSLNNPFRSFELPPLVGVAFDKQQVHHDPEVEENNGGHDHIVPIPQILP